MELAAYAEGGQSESHAGAKWLKLLAESDSIYEEVVTILFARKEKLAQTITSVADIRVLQDLFFGERE